MTVSQYFLCSLHDLPNFKARGFKLDTNHGDIELVAIRYDEKVSVYKNNCPHLNVPLNWQPDEFMSLEGTHIQCSTHGALFAIEDGHCISGPCRGQNLSSLTIEQKNDELWLQL